MDKYQKRKLKSYKQILLEADNNQVSVKLIPKFEKGILLLKIIVAEIDKLQLEQEKDITGITVGKNFTEEELTNLIIDIAGAVHSYADEKNDYALMELVNYKPGRISKMDEADVVAAAGIVNAEALKVPAADLLEEGISAEEITRLGEILEYYRKVKLAPREAIIGRSNVTSKMRDEFTKATRLLKNSLNRLATQFRTKDPDFYQKYQSARNII